MLDVKKETGQDNVYPRKLYGILILVFEILPVFITNITVFISNIRISHGKWENAEAGAPEGRGNFL